MKKADVLSKGHLITLLLIIIVSLLLKLIIFGLFYHDPSQVLRNDSNGYLIPAKFLVTTGHYWVAPNHYMFFRTPGYPVLIASLFYFFGIHLPSIVVAQILLNTISIVCFYIVGTRLFFPAVGLLAAAFAAFDYLLWSYAYAIMTDGVFATVLSLAILCSVLALTGKKYFYLNVFFLGLSLSLATLIRPIGYFLIFPVAIGFILYALVCCFSLKRIVFTMVFLFLPFVILVGGWQVRNKVTVNTYKFSGITSQKGVRDFFPQNFYKYTKKHHISTTGRSLGIVSDVRLVLSYPKDTFVTMTKGFERVMVGIDEVLPSFFGYKNEMAEIRKIKKAMFHFNMHKLKSIQYSKLHEFTIIYFFGALLINIVFYFFIICGLIIAGRKGFLTESKGKFFSHLFLLGVVLYFVIFSSNASGYARFRVAFQSIIDFYAAVGASLLFILICAKRKEG